MLKRLNQVQPLVSGMLAIAMIALSVTVSFADDKESKGKRKFSNRYVIGVSASSKSMGALRSHMPELKDKGLLVYYVGKTTPAAKAGLKRYDILLSANGKELKTLSNLGDVVTDSGKEGKSVTIGFLRGGKNQKAKVKPMLLSDAIKNYRKNYSSKSKKGSSASHHGRHRSGYHHRSSSSSQVSKEIAEMKKQIKDLKIAVGKLNKKHED